MRRVALVLAALLAAAAPAAAEPDKRPLPDYDGREPAPTTAGDVLIWVPRIIMSPVYLVTEYVVRRPLSVGVPAAEKGNVIQYIDDFINGRGHVGIMPTFYYDLQTNPHVGVYVFVNDLFVKKSELRLAFTAGNGYIATTLADRFKLADDLVLTLRGYLSSRSDLAFYGLGPDPGDNRARYEARRLEASSGVAWGPAARKLQLAVGERSVHFGGDSCCNDPSLVEAVGRGWFPLPFGFSDGGYNGPFAHLTLTLDTRTRAPATGAGIALDGELASDLDAGRSWVKTGARVGASVDLDGYGRVLGLVVGAQIAEPLDGPDVPFSEQVALGGEVLPGFPFGSLIGRSGVDAMLSYEWPIWVWLVGATHVALGNAFGPHFSGFEPDLLRFSAGIGIRSIGNFDHRFQLMLAFGTPPLGRGSGIDSVQLVFGGVTGF